MHSLSLGHPVHGCPGQSDGQSCLTNHDSMQVTISLLEQAMTKSGHRRFLIDGFPRNEENRASFEKQVGATSCSEGHQPRCLHCCSLM